MPAKTTPVEESEKGESRYTKIAFHGCAHDYQDKKYGQHQRVFNRTKQGWRCTVCGGNV